MSGASRAHNRISLNLAMWLREKIKGGACEIYISDVKLRIAHRRSYYYPDLLMGCEPADDDPYYLEHPCLVMEVLSTTTEFIDRREKLLAYRTIPSLQVYVLAAQERMQVEVYTPAAEGRWQQESYTDAAEIVRLPCVQEAIPLAVLYEGVKLLAPPEE